MNGALDTLPDPEELEHIATFLIEMRSPSENQIQRWLRKEPWRLKKYKEHVGTWVMAGRVNKRIPLCPAGERRHVHFTRSHKSERYRLDDDNLAAGLKPVRDALVLQKLLVDDSAKHATFSYAQEKQTDGEDWIEVDIFRHRGEP